MNEEYGQKKKPILLRSFEADVAKALGIQAEEAAQAVAKKKKDFQIQKQSESFLQKKRNLFFFSGMSLLFIAIGAVLYIYYTHTKPPVIEVKKEMLSVPFEMSGEELLTAYSTISTLPSIGTQTPVSIIFTKNDTPLSLAEIYTLLPNKKGDNKSSEFQSFFYIYNKKEDTVDAAILLKENTNTTPLIPNNYDDFIFSFAIHLLNLSDEAKKLLSEERFTSTFINNIPVRSISVQTENGEEGVIFTRIKKNGAITIMTEEAFRSGLLDTLSTDPIVLSL